MALEERDCLVEDVTGKWKVNVLKNQHAMEEGEGEVTDMRETWGEVTDMREICDVCV